mgnify:FL=1
MLMRPAPDLPTYPGEVALHLRRKRNAAGYWVEPLVWVTQYKYLGVLLHHSGSLATHVEKIVQPAVVSKVAALAASVITRDVLTPLLSMKMLDVDVLSYVRYSCALWGNGTPAAWGDPPLDAAIAAIARTISRTLPGMMDASYALSMSSTLLGAELNWQGMPYHYWRASLGLLRDVVRMAAHRLPRQILWVRLQQAVEPRSDDPPLVMHPMHSPLRMAHLEGEVDPVYRRKNLARGPGPAGSAPHRTRIDAVIGRTPAQASAVYVDRRLTGGDQGTYTWTHLQYDLRGGHVVIPAGEAAMSELDRRPVQSPPPQMAHERSGPSYDAYVLRHYAWYCLGRTRAVANGGPAGTPWLAGLLLLVRPYGGIASLKGALVAGKRAEVTRLMSHLELMHRGRARFPQQPSARWRLHSINYTAWWRSPRQGMACGLATAKHSRYGDVDVGIISKARCGVYALGYAVDSVYPPARGPFCPCCKEPVSETWAHHLLGRCSCTHALHQHAMPRLMSLMTMDSHQWREEYLASAAEPDGQAALILCAADAATLCSPVRDQVAQLLATWLQAILEGHPLCSR